jgi:diguanylate cyclase (GGDEF)-like protein/PAS domain S-box-containing protein
MKSSAQKQPPTGDDSDILEVDGRLHADLSTGHVRILPIDLGPLDPIDPAGPIDPGDPVGPLGRIGDAERKGAPAEVHPPDGPRSFILLSGIPERCLREDRLLGASKGQSETFSLLRTVRAHIDRRMMEEARRAERERAEVTLNCIADAVVCSDVSGGITFLNTIAEQMTACSRREALGANLSKVVRIIDAKTRASLPMPHWDSAEETGPSCLLVHALLVQPDGNEIPIEGSLAPIRDRQGAITGTVLIFRDVGEARAAALRITHAAQHDYLTGLPNRMLLHDRMGQAISISFRHKKKVAVLFLDLDGFKSINDSLGHRFGDKLLQSVARRLVGCVRGSDSVSRQGGDEFVALLSEVEHSEDAAITARRMLHAVAEPHSIDGHDVHVTASIGVSVYPDDGLDADNLIRNADTAMYQAKEGGRDRYACFKPAMNARAAERQFIEESLRRALEHEEFALQYQPKVNLKTGAITGVEALLRWTHPARGSISPAHFIPVAADCGLIQGIDRWVVQEACRQAGSWIREGLRPVTMAVNVSAVALRSHGFLDGVFGALRDTGLEPAALELELAESVLMERSQLTGSLLKTLRSRGVKLAVDNFGAGHSSLSYLRELSIDSLKIDQSFVRQGAGDDTAIVAAVIGMGRSLNLRVVAEGVETPEEVAFLQTHACDEAQGYFFSRPMSAEGFATLLATGALPRATLPDRDPAQATTTRN